MRQSSKRVPDSAEKTSGIFAEPAEDKIRIVLEGLRGEDSIAEARKGSIRTSTAVGRRSSWRQARNSSPATRRARRPRTRSRNSRLSCPAQETLAEVLIENRLLKREATMRQNYAVLYGSGQIP